MSPRPGRNERQLAADQVVDPQRAGPVAGRMMFEQHNRVLIQKAHRDGVVPGGDREGVATLVQAVPLDAGMLPSS